LSGDGDWHAALESANLEVGQRKDEEMWILWQNAGRVYEKGGVAVGGGSVPVGG